MRHAGGVTQAYYSGWPPFALRRRCTGRRAAGVRYEKAVQTHLRAQSHLYLDSPWLRFLDETGWHWCQPDGMHLDFAAGILTIVEVKYQHTPQAWEQMEELYSPVLRHLFPAFLWQIRYLEVVKWYDPAVVCRDAVRLVAAPFAQHYLRGVHIWKP